MIAFDEAVSLIGRVAAPLGSEPVALGEAAERVLAAPVTARIDAPRSDQSAMDGYAVRSADLPGRLRVAGQSFPGAGFDGTVRPGTCVRIFTGAPIPAGADRVVIQEVVERDGDYAIFGPPASESRHIRAMGSDFRMGEVLLDVGQHLGPRAIVAAAAADVGKLEVRRVPRVVILATGDELAEPGQTHRTAGGIPESVSFGIAALARRWGGRVVATRRLRDDLPIMKESAREALDAADVVVVTGGASVGERDFAKPMFEDLGLETIFSKVAIKPGKPVWLGKARGRLVLGLPGNPTSAMVTGRLLLAPLVAGLAGRSGALEWRSARLAAPLPPCGDRETFVRAMLLENGVAPVINQDSGAQKILVDSDMLVRCRPHSPGRAAGERIEALAF